MAAVPRDPQMSEEMQRRKEVAEEAAAAGTGAAISGRRRILDFEGAAEMQRQPPHSQAEMEQQKYEQQQSEEEKPRQVATQGTADGIVLDAPSLHLAAQPPTTPHAAGCSPSKGHPASSGEVERRTAESPTGRHETDPTPELSLPAAPPPVAVPRRSASVPLGLDSQPAGLSGSGSDAPAPASANAVSARYAGYPDETCTQTAVHGPGMEQHPMRATVSSMGGGAAAGAEGSSWYAEHVLPWPSTRNLPIGAQPQVSWLPISFRARPGLGSTATRRLMDQSRC